MPPNSKVTEEPVHCNESEKKEFKAKVVWRNVTFIAYLHFAMLYGVYLIFTSSNWKTSLFALIYLYGGALGITAGSHRLWSHSSYKAKWPLRVFLCIMFTINAQCDIYNWCREHRVHHKFAETDADPHNVKRGLFFAHVGWLMCKKHPDVAKKGKTIFLEDVWADPIVRFHRRYFIPLVLFIAIYLPTMIPVWGWGETAWNSFFVAAIARYCLSLHLTWLVNSAGHMYGDQPFDKYMEARENPVLALLTIGEGWHNYHHAFPWDYSTSELGYTINFTKLFIDAMAKIGLAYDLKTANANSIKNRKLRSGDGTRLERKDQPKNVINGSSN